MAIVLRHGGLGAHMEKREEAKTTRWAFTAYEDQWSLFDSMPPIVAEWGWQQEICPETQREHYQGFVRTSRQVRFSQIQKVLPGVHLEPAKNWDALVNYCKKLETAVEGTQVHQISTNVSLTMARALIKVAEARDKSASWISVLRNCENVKELKEKYAAEFERAVAGLLREDENLIGLYSQPQYERAYVKWRSVWTEKADEKTDRQTDKEEKEVTFVVKTPRQEEE